MRAIIIDTVGRAMGLAVLGVLAALVAGGCGVRSGCDADPTECTVKPTTLTGSLTDWGGTLIVGLSYADGKLTPPSGVHIDPPATILLGSGAGAKVSLSDAPVPALTPMSDTSVSIEVAPADVMTLSGGQPIDVSVTIDSAGALTGGKASGPIAFQQQFPVNDSIQTSTHDIPRWVGVWKPQKVMTLEEYSNAQGTRREIAEYDFQAPSTLSGPTVDPTFDGLDQSTVAGVDGASIFTIPGKNLMMEAQELAMVPGLAVLENDSRQLIAYSDPGMFAQNVTVDMAGKSIGMNALLGIGDLDGDTRPDLVVGDGTQVLVLLQRTAGTIAYDQSYSASLQTALSGASALAVGNLGPTHVGADIAVATGSTIQLIQNLGQGRFFPHQPALMGPSIDSLAIGDVDGDGHNDIVASSSTAQSLYVWLNQSK